MKNKILNLINSIEFQELNSYYNEKTIFGALNVERNENRHSAFIAWWLNPKSEHGLGDAPLKLFLRLVATKESGEIIFKKNKNDCSVDFYSRVLAGDYNITIREDFELEKSVGKLNSDNSKGRIDIWSALELTVKDEDGKDSSLAVGMLIENKIYSNEGKNQTVRYFEAVNSYMNEFPSEMEYSSVMGILLTATKQKPSCDQFTNITYQELLTYVIEPLMSSVDADSLQFVKHLSANWLFLRKRRCFMKAQKTASLLKERTSTMLERVVTNNRDIFENAFASLYPSADVKKIIGERYETLTSDNVDDDNILRMLWDANEILFKAVIYHLYGEHSAKLDKLFKSSNRDNSKYLVSYNGKEIFPDKRLSKAMAACAIFKAYLMEYPATTLAELRKAFPCEKLNAYYYDRYYNDLFYESNPDNVDETGYEILTYTAGKHKGKEAKAKWDFYLDEEKLLPIENGQKNAMCVKMWRKGDFDKLVEFVEENYKFIVIEEC